MTYQIRNAAGKLSKPYSADRIKAAFEAGNIPDGCSVATEAGDIAVEEFVLSDPLEFVTLESIKQTTPSRGVPKPTISKLSNAKALGLLIGNIWRLLRNVGKSIRPLLPDDPYLSSAIVCLLFLGGVYGVILVAFPSPATKKPPKVLAHLPESPSAERKATPVVESKTPVVVQPAVVPKVVPHTSVVLRNYVRTFAEEQEDSDPPDVSDWAMMQAIREAVEKTGFQFNASYAGLCDYGTITVCFDRREADYIVDYTDGAVSDSYQAYLYKWGNRKFGAEWRPPGSADAATMKQQLCSLGVAVASLVGVPKAEMYTVFQSQRFNTAMNKALKGQRVDQDFACGATTVRFVNPPINLPRFEFVVRD